MEPKQVYHHYAQVGRPAGLFRFCPHCQSELEEIEIDGRTRAACSRCGFIQYKNPAPVVSLLILCGDQVLLGKRAGDPGRGRWATPSGYIEYEDDFLATAIREAREETGLVVEIRSILNVQSSFVSERYHFLGVYLLAEALSGELTAGDDLEAIAWFPRCGPFPEMAFAEDADLLEAFARGGWAGLPVDPRYARA